MKSLYKLSVGDMTLIEDRLPRGAWQMGRIKELVNSRDGEVRFAKIVLPNNKIIGRPLNVLFPMECHTTDEVKETIQSYDGVNDRTQGDDQRIRVSSMRDAAMKAEQRIREQLKDN